MHTHESAPSLTFLKSATGHLCLPGKAIGLRSPYPLNSGLVVGSLQKVDELRELFHEAHLCMNLEK